MTTPTPQQLFREKVHARMGPGIVVFEDEPVEKVVEPPKEDDDTVMLEKMSSMLDEVMSK